MASRKKISEGICFFSRSCSGNYFDLLAECLVQDLFKQLRGNTEVKLLKGERNVGNAPPPPNSLAIQPSLNSLYVNQLASYHFTSKLRSQRECRYCIWRMFVIRKSMVRILFLLLLQISSYLSQWEIKALLK